MGADDITIASTTDEQAAVNEAAGMPPEHDPNKPEPVTREAEEDRPESETGEPARERLHQPRYRGGVQKRIDRLTQEKYELQQRLREVEDAARRGTPIPPARTEAEHERWREHEPAFNTEAPYVPQEEVERRAEELVRQRQEAEANAAENARLQQVYADHQRRVTAALEAHPDRDTILEKAKDLAIHPTIAGMVLSQPNSHEIALHFVAHPEDLAALHQAPSFGDAYANVVRLSERLHVKHAPRPRPSASRAPAPTTPVGTSRATSVSLEDADYQTFKKERERQARSRYR